MRDKKMLKVLAFSGSLRKQSFNTMALKAAQGLAPDGMNVELFDLSEMPLFNQDLEANLPEAVKKFKEAVKDADAIIFGCPEYNYSITGVLKNAIDWATRPDGDNSFNDKPGAIIGASDGRFGTVRAQFHLRQICVSLNMHII